ncbi:unnamed protein product [Orchesella dallaii]|uniref:Uncharacterized protein n=1 Tax=Orchesella dallaii TaxID=48710 RepID=A0ABP1S2P2_9HEXA
MKVILPLLTASHLITFIVMVTLIISYRVNVTAGASSATLQKLTRILLIPPSDKTIVYSKVFYHSYINIICFGNQRRINYLTSTVITSMKDFVAVQFQEMSVQNSTAIFQAIKKNTHRSSPVASPRSIPVTICYLCGAKDFVFNHSFQLSLSNEISNIVFELSESFMKLCKTGHGSALHYSSYMNPVKDVSLCEYDVMFLVKSNCFHIHAILSLVLSRTNLTWSNSKSLEPFQTYTGPVSVDACFHFNLYTTKNIKLLLGKLYEVEGVKYFYCEEGAQFESIRHSVFVDRVDNLVWLLITILSAVISILNGNMFSGLGIFLIMIDQSIKFKGFFKRQRILVPTFVVIFLSWWYRSMISTDMIAPFPPKVISTCEELFKAGYKFIAGSEQELVRFNAVTYDVIKQNCKVELSEQNFILNPDLAFKLSQFGGSQIYHEMAKVKGITGIWGSHAVALKKVQSGAKRSTNLLSCNVLKKSLRRLYNMIFFKTFLKTRISWICDAIIASGISNMYNSRMTDRLISSSNFHRQNCTNSADINCSLEIGLSLNSPIIIGFYVLLCFLSIAAFSFIMELACRLLPIRRNSVNLASIKCITDKESWWM